MHTPEKIMSQFGLCRLFELRYMTPSRVHACENVSNDSILTSSVQALQHDEKRMLFFGVQDILEPIQLLDTWDPGRILELMATEGLSVGGGTPYYVTSLLDHPSFTPAHLANMQYAGFSGAPVPPAVARCSSR